MIVYIMMAILDDKGKVAKRGKTNHECLNMALLSKRDLPSQFTPLC